MFGRCINCFYDATTVPRDEGGRFRCPECGTEQVSRLTPIPRMGPSILAGAAVAVGVSVPTVALSLALRGSGMLSGLDRDARNVTCGVLCVLSALGAIALAVVTFEAQFRGRRRESGWGLDMKERSLLGICDRCCPILTLYGMLCFLVCIALSTMLL